MQPSLFLSFLVLSKMRALLSLLILSSFSAMPFTNAVYGTIGVNHAPIGKKLYDATLEGSSWCVAKENTTKEVLQAALDYACGEGGADCRLIQPGAACYETEMEAIASFAFNSYYQKNARVAGTCNFNGAAYVATRPPRGKCFSTAEPRDRNDVQLSMHIRLVGYSCLLLVILLIICVAAPQLVKRFGLCELLKLLFQCCFVQ